jgi:hypothetical protein
MDKRGSGLADVMRWTHQSGGNATFAPTEDANGFVASLTARDLDPDPITGTVDPGEIEHFVSNLMPVVIDGDVYVAPSSAVSRHEVYDAHPDVVLPPFAFDVDRLFTFVKPNQQGSPFRQHISGEPVVCAFAELVNDAASERIAVQLLNSVVLGWARTRGLCTDGRRLWFPRSDAGPHEVTYRARIREATRTVTKPNVSRASGEVRYWEHEALRFAFRRYEDTWTLQLVTTFVFTTDGFEKLLRGPKVGPLATRRMARDYNSQVQNDLFFWRWVLTDGQTDARLDQAVIVRGSFLSRDVVDAPAATGPLGSAGNLDDIDVDDISDEVAEIAAGQGEQASDESQ